MTVGGRRTGGGGAPFVDLANDGGDLLGRSAAGGIASAGRDVGARFAAGGGPPLRGLPTRI